jgi:hypothetical protein
MGSWGELSCFDLKDEPKPLWSRQLRVPIHADLRQIFVAVCTISGLPTATEFPRFLQIAEAVQLS